jgi:hypothetical protein
MSVPLNTNLYSGGERVESMWAAFANPPVVRENPVPPDIIDVFVLC